MGRFITKDFLPGNIYSPSSLHRYVYVENNPVNWIDLFGLCKEKKEILQPWMLVIGATSLATPWPGDEEVVWIFIGAYAAYQGGKIFVDWMISNPPFHWSFTKSKEADFPANPDEWMPPPGVKEEPKAKARSGGKHRQWKDETGRTVRRWDKGEPGKPGWRGRDHWHDENGRHVLPQ